MPKVVSYGMTVEPEGNTIAVSLLPAENGKVLLWPPQEGGHMSMTYIFDSTGLRLIKKIYNR